MSSLDIIHRHGNKVSFHTTEEVQRGFFRANSASRDATYPARRREQERLKRRRCE
jgi:hypothetical protein